MNKIKVTAVSYLNTKPLLYGIFQNGLENEIALELDIPSVCAQKLKSGEADLGLVPVAIIPELETPYIVSDYCIGTIGTVKTVCIYSCCPIEELTHLYLDYHSRTSVELVKVLLKKYWKLQPEFIKAQPGFETKINETHGALIIGDRAMGLEEKYPFVYDLGEAWLDFTGLPFVFAAWVSNKPLDEIFVRQFNAALANGIAHIPQLVYLLPTPHSGFDLKEYFTNNISYELDEQKKKGLSLFLDEISETIQPSLQLGLSS